MIDVHAERYVSLATFRRNGTEVATPVWIAGSERSGFVFTNIGSGKVKRIRNNGRARMAPCKARGEVTGPWTDVRAELVVDAEVRDRGIRTLVDKYGWQMRVFLIGYKLTGRQEQMALIQITQLDSGEENA